MTDANRREFLRTSGVLLGGIAIGTQVTAATRTDRFLVQTKGNKTPKDLDVVHEMEGVKYVVVEGDESAVENSKAVKDYAADIEVELDAPEPNDDVPEFDASDYEGQPGDFLQWDKDDLNVSEAFEITEGEDSRVAVIDTGVLETHPDLAGPLNLELSQNFTDDGGDHNPANGNDHGTHVAGIVAADNTAGLGVNGTAPQTDLVDCRVFSAEGGASFADILAAVVYCANNDVDVANLSLGAYPIPRQELGSFYGKVLNSTMTYANKEGTLLVIAAGNDSADLQHDKNFIALPAEGAQGLAVAATGPIGYGWDADGDDSADETTDFQDPPESPAFYTNYGTNAVTLGAPGGDADLGAIDTGVPWFNDLVFNTIFTRRGTLVSGTFGPDADDHPGSVTADWSGKSNENVSVSGDPPYTTDKVSWYSSVGFGGVRFDVSGTEFTGDETVTVDYSTGTGHERSAPDWIALGVTVPADSDNADPTEYVVVDWQVSEPSGTTVSWTADDDSFGDGAGGVFKASSVEKVFSEEDINPSSPSASPSDVIDKGTVQSVGVFSGGGIGKDESVDITYEEISFEENDLLIQAPAYGWKAGTSMAAPNVAGAAALVKSADEDLNANQVESILKRTASVPEEYDKTYYGSGYLDVVAAVEEADSGGDDDDDDGEGNGKDKGKGKGNN